MKRALTALAGALLFALALSACGSDDGREVTLGAAIATETFDAPGTWEVGTYPAEADAPESTLAIEEGRYVLEHTAGRAASFTWGAGGDAYDDVIVEVGTEQLSEHEDNLYGVGCRLAGDDADTQSGYVFLISGDGHYAIGELSAQTLTVDTLLPWHQTDVIAQGAARNTIRAVCLGDYLALYANGEFLGEVTDDTYRRAGQIGFFAGASEEGDITVAFDDVTLYEGAVGED